MKDSLLFLVVACAVFLAPLGFAQKACSFMVALNDGFTVIRTFNDTSLPSSSYCITNMGPTATYISTTNCSAVVSCALNSSLSNGVRVMECVPTTVIGPPTESFLVDMANETITYYRESPNCSNGGRTLVRPFCAD